MKRRLLVVIFMLTGCRQPEFQVYSSKTTLLANGYDNMVLRIDGVSAPPRIEIRGDRLFCHVHGPHLTRDHWQAELQSGVMPGIIRIRVASDKKHLDQSVTVIPQLTDSADDGTPDFFRLESAGDRESFRHWITYLAELQYFISPSSRPPEIIDCSSLVRYAYREGLRDHDAAWAAGAQLPVVQAYSSISKYSFPHTLLGPRIFRIRTGSFKAADLIDGSFSEFGDAKNLQKFNTFFVSRDISRAQPGDILFYRRDTSHGLSYHSMIFVGPSKVKPDAEIYVVYHTGPDGTNNGEIRRLTVTQLLHFPNPQWQPIAANELFLGVYRWNILKVTS
jgi:uncharacterized protein